MGASESTETLKRTPLYDLHVELGGKMVPFAGYEMPVQYPMGILTEHQHTRSGAGLFDVSHMGQIRLRGESFAQVASALERLCPADFQSLEPGQQRYSFFTNNAAGILDDLMVTRAGKGDDKDHLIMVVNACVQGRRTSRTCRPTCNNRCEVEPMVDRALHGAAGPARRRGDGRSIAPDSAVDEVHDRPAAQRRRHAVLRHALRLYRRGRLRDLGAGRRSRQPGAQAAGRPGGEADRPRRARFAAARGRALPLRQRHHRDHDAGRGRLSSGRSRSAGARRAASRAPASCSASWPTARRASASASCRTARRRRAPIPRSPTSMAR